MDKKMEEIDSILDKIDKKQKNIDGINREINTLALQLNDLCRDAIFSKFRKGLFITHKDKYVFELGEPWTIFNCHVNVESFADIEHKSFYTTANHQPICRAVSFLYNARPSTKEEIEDYYICRKMAQCKALGI